VSIGCLLLTDLDAAFEKCQKSGEAQGGGISGHNAKQCTGRKNSQMRMHRPTQAQPMLMQGICMYATG
jgi:hypothetical protein